MTQCLADLSPRYVFAEKFKDSAQGSSHHRIVTPAAFDAMLQGGEFVQWHARYGRRYGLARATLDSALASGKWPIVHVGRLPNLVTLQEGVDRSLSILLRCREDTLRSRLAIRHPGDLGEQERRLEAMREELAETREAVGLFDIVFDNDFADPREAATLLHQRITEFAEARAGA